MAADSMAMNAKTVKSDAMRSVAMPGTRRGKSVSTHRNDPVFSSARPAEFPRRILLAVTGLSPQVVTETVYALSQKAGSQPPFVPTEIHLLTTAEGAERARLMLLSGQRWFERLRRDYDLPEIKFDEQTIYELTAADGAPIRDIRTREENTRLADALTETIRKLTADQHCALHVSIAGGRKTMGFYAGYALSLYGRPQDRLSHVLVSDHYESNPDFFYPTPRTHVIYASENRPLDAHKAEIELAEIPFVRLRPELDERLLKGTATFSEVVEAAQRALDPPLLEIDLDRQWICAAGQRLRLPPAQLAFMSWLARRAKQGRPGVRCPEGKGPNALNKDYAREYLGEYAHLSDEANSSIATRLRNGMDKIFFEEIKAKLLGRLREGLGPEGAQRYGVVGEGRPKVFRIPVPAESIHWLDRTGHAEAASLRK